MTDASYKKQLLNCFMPDGYQKLEPRNKRQGSYRAFACKLALAQDLLVSQEHLSIHCSSISVYTGIHTS